ncbi:thiol reductant ABC exporter subunit CydD [Celerinatantimonas diazotrophica]|uniref:ATP-binding cassette subfamily C protein CydD n=1 Tax=Celerinatantimonas diazotrophica TaxID=412034 RepID=A0A4R1K3U3_9GAMM|nr:thiol reductant ABC exporter subunit CydD [Celerinatantimonas diazotrophica]TCK58754.1 ATP-binding cassette subfamily C protein CydD [Celerinatantimonas diazotrophica]CAG9297385.1 ATP-binding/permease protein CydD [Celerinatantimonas diazotrophica]
MANPAPLQDKEKTLEFERWLKNQAKTVKKPLNIAIIIGSINGFFLIAQCWMLAQVLNATAIEHKSIQAVWGYLACMVGIFGVRALLNYGNQRFTFEAAARLRTDLRARLFKQINQLGPAWSREQRSGARATELVDGVEALEKYFSLYLPQRQLAIIIPVAILVFVFPFDWISGLILAITAPLLPVFMILIGSQTEKLNQKQWRSLTRMGAHFFDMIEGLTTLKLFHAAQREARFIGQIAEDYRLQTMKVLRVAFLSSMVLEFFAAISIAMVAVYVGFRLMGTDIHYLNGIFVLLLAPEFYLPLRSMGTQFHARMDALGAVEPIIELLNTPIPAEHHGNIELCLNQAPDITLSNLVFAYPKRDPVIRDVSLKLPAGSRTAIIGASGAGKSTLGQLLLGFLSPIQGDIIINTTPLTQISPNSWYQHVAWLPQNPTLFYGTIEENIALSRRQHGHEQALQQALRDAHALDFIEQLPHGVQTVLGEHGQGLSGGEIQRIALARAFYKNAPVVLLDEPSASLDPQSERLITDAIARLAVGRTLLTIAHRLTTIEQSDQIVVLEGGKIIEQGAPEELMSLNGAYAQRYHEYCRAG